VSIHVAAGASNYLSSTTNLSNPQSFTKLVWIAHDANPSGYNDILGAQNNTNASSARIITEASTAYLYNQTSFTNIGGAPTLTDWICFALTGTTAGAGSLIGYWQDNAGGGFTSNSETGLGFTNYLDSLWSTSNVGMQAAFYMEWNVVLTLAQLNAQFLSATPVIGSGLRRYLALASSTSAGMDSSGNGYNFTVSGTVTTGASAPVFPTKSGHLLTSLGVGG
jgi:hypothetical protein